mgnify:CR=1 FL=1
MMCKTMFLVHGVECFIYLHSTIRKTSRKYDKTSENIRMSGLRKPETGLYDILRNIKKFTKKYIKGNKTNCYSSDVCTHTVH